MCTAISRAKIKKSKMRSITDMLRKEQKQSYKCSIKTTKGRKSIEGKDRNKEQGQQIEISNKYGRY